MLDGHNDLAILIRFIYQNDLYNESFIEKFENGGMFGQVDLPRLKNGKAGGAFWSAFTPCPSNGTDFSDSNYAECELYCLILVSTSDLAKPCLSENGAKIHSCIHDTLPARSPPPPHRALP